MAWRCIDCISLEWLAVCGIMIVAKTQTNESKNDHDDVTTVEEQEQLKKEGEGIKKEEYGTEKADSDPLALDTIKQTLFVLQFFEDGPRTDLDLVDALRGEASLARAHMLFFRAAGWIEKQEESDKKEAQSQKWRLTYAGKYHLGILRQSVR